jgi:hypothetical protein
LYTLIAFLSVFVFNVDLKDFLSTVGLIYLSFYNLVKEFKLNTYSMFYSWFNPSSFDNLIKDIRSYVDNSNNRIKAFTTAKVEAKVKELDLKSSEFIEGLKPLNNQVKESNLNTSTTPNHFNSSFGEAATPYSVDMGPKDNSEPFRDRYKLTLVQDYIRINSWDIITSPYFYIPFVVTITISTGYFLSDYWLPILPMIPSFFIDFFTGKPSDDSGPDFIEPPLSPTGSTYSEIRIIEPPLSPTGSTSPEIRIASPTESVTSSTSNTSTEVPRNSPKSPIVQDNITNPSPVRTFSSESFNAWVDSQSKTAHKLEMLDLQDPFSNVSPFNTPSPVTTDPATPSPISTSNRVDPVNIPLPESPSPISASNKADPVNIPLPESPSDPNLPASPSTSSTSSAPSKASHPFKRWGMEREFDKFFR